MGEDTVTTGMIQGGWGYVWAVYGFSWAVLAVYTIRAFVLRRLAAGGDA